MGEMERKTRLARLLVAPPDMVFEELKAYSADVQRSPYTFSDDAMEATLAERNDPLIDLGLAGYGACREVVAAMYRKGREETEDAREQLYRKGLRLAVMGNEAVGTKGLRGFPDYTLSPDEVAHIMVHADSDEAALLVTNQTVSDDVLLALYRNQKWAPEMDEDRRRDMISMTGRNPRLTRNDSDEFGPDMGHWDLHKAIFEMLETVPTSKWWIGTLNYLLRRLDPYQTTNPDSIDAVLERWKFDENGKVEAPRDDDRYNETGLTDRAEFRCLIAALYGKRYGPKKVVVHGSADDEDVARRCAFYGNASLTEKDLEVGYERDKDVFTFAAVTNDDVFTKRALRKKFEEDCLTGTHRWRYDQRLEQLQKRWKWFDPRPTAEWMVDEQPKFDDPLWQKVGQIGADVKRLVELSRWLPWLIAAMAAGIAFR